MPMLISTAYAQGTGLSGLLDNQSTMLQFLPLVLIFVVFYFLLIRPQQRKAKEHRATLDALRRGDRVVTGGGIIGTVVRVESPDEVSVDIADGVRVRVVRGTITSVVAKPDPAAAREAAKQKEQTRAKAETKD
jgi:preprotein translocase subunit YajC